MIGRNDACPCGSGKKYKKCCQDLPPFEPHAARSPEELLRLRFHAARAGHFGFIYDTTHPESLLRQHYPTKAEYVLYGQQTLLEGFRPLKCRGFAQRSLAGDEVELIFWLQTETDEGPQDLYELGRFIRTEEGWCYHSGQKLSTEDYSGQPDELTFDHFDRVTHKIVY